MLVYGAGEAAVRFISLLLLPLFTAYLTPADYGIIAILGILMMVLVPLFSLGFGTSLGICYFASEDPEARGTAVASAAAVLAGMAALLFVAGLPAVGPLSRLAFGTAQYSHLVALTIGAAAAAILAQPLMQAVQFDGRARTFVVLSAVSSLVTIGLALVMVVGLRRGARGWVEADLLARIATLGLFALATLPRARFRVKSNVVRELVRLGLPVLPGAGFVFILQQGNKYILQRMSGLASAGLYNVGFNLGNAALGLPVGALQRAWTPHFMGYAARPEEARGAFGRIMTLYVFAFGGLALLVVIVARAAVLVLTQPPFHQAYQVVGLVALAQVLFGAFLLLLPGPYFARDVGATTLAQAAAALVAVAVNVVLIRAWGMVGAGVGLVAGAAAQAVLQHLASRRRGHLAVDYDWPRIGRFALLFLIVLAGMLPARNLGLAAELALSAGVAAVALPLWVLILPRSERAWLRERLRGIGRG